MSFSVFPAMNCFFFHCMWVGITVSMHKQTLDQARTQQTASSSVRTVRTTGIHSTTLLWWRGLCTLEHITGSLTIPSAPPLVNRSDGSALTQSVEDPEDPCETYEAVFYYLNNWDLECLQAPNGSGKKKYSEAILRRWYLSPVTVPTSKPPSARFQG